MKNNRKARRAHLQPSPVRGRRSFGISIDDANFQTTTNLKDLEDLMDFVPELPEPLRRRSYARR